MSGIAVIGAQWGDEGKGKVIDLLSAHVDVVARYQGGPNAGHTVQVGKQKFFLHHIPSGILHGQTTCIVGNGTSCGEWQVRQGSWTAPKCARLTLRRTHTLSS